MTESTSTSTAIIIASAQIKTGTEADFELFANNLLQRWSHELSGCLAKNLCDLGGSEGQCAFTNSADADPQHRAEHFRQIGGETGEHLARTPMTVQFKSF